MHLSSLDMLRICLKKHVLPDRHFRSELPIRIADVGSADINGSYRQIFDLLECEYTGIDIEAGHGVSVVLESPYSFPISDNEYDIVFSGQTFEHAGHFWKTFSEMCRITKPEGLIIVIAPSEGAVHRYPVDCYRFMPDAMAALAEHGGVTLVDSWTSKFGPFYDAVGVFRKCGLESQLRLSPPDFTTRLNQPVQNNYPSDVPDEIEHGAGTEDCYDFLARVHQLVKPRFYAEIGVEYGHSLRLADCPALGIDPAPQLIAPLNPQHDLSLTSSDDFFMMTDAASRLQPIDLSYIDGMHQIEFVLKDFMHIEMYSHAGSVVIIDDIYPAHALQGERIRQSRFWTGDVWKILKILSDVRPDLILLPLDTSPTGSLLVLGLDPDNRELWEKFDLLIYWSINNWTETPDEIVQRSHKFDPQDPLISRVLTMIHEGRQNGTELSALERIKRLVSGSLPRLVVQS